ncbi:MAG: multiprotein bridging factor aMBF1 [Thermoplasmatales archaeon]
MNCELCGKQTNRLFDVIIDGVHMRVCAECLKYGKEIPKKPEIQHRNIAHLTSPPPAVHAAHTERQRGADEDVEEPIEDYGKIIKKKREEMGLSQEQLASKLQEKKNLIAKIEREEIKPDKQIARKMEKVMGIKVLERIQ